MKKLVIGMLTLLITASFYQGYKKPLSTSRQAPFQKTLNGYDRQRALGMISNFKGRYAKDYGLKSISAWYSKADIQNMLDLLTKEGNDPNILTDGVRFYFGSETAPGTTKLDVKILLVSTMAKTPVAPDHTSQHGDYYDHTANYLGSANVTGDAMQDAAGHVFQNRGLLYGSQSPIPNVKCPNPDAHLILGNDAYNWVQRRHDKDDNGIPPLRDKSAYNTESEWFDICFISSLFSAVVNPNNNLDGIRVYLGNGRKVKNQPPTKRDVFILVPTRAKGSYHQDAYDCLNIVPTSLCALNIGGRFLKTKLTPVQLKLRFKSKYFVTPYFLDAGYDIGELCPSICN
ncbi:MAG: hypothetical protein JWP94_2062 [Mucilaginibacter sp.]|jgi:hypothetical protein|nr:hypothetical protein [Mucilaginibacter sp.]